MSEGNLLEETIEIIKENGYSVDDVEWVGSVNGEFAITWEDFTKISNIIYDSGYGGQEIASDLCVVGYDWWLTRSEYDGSEGWAFNQHPTKSSEAKPFEKVKSDTGDVWAKISEMNRVGGKYAD